MSKQHMFGGLVRAAALLLCGMALCGALAQTIAWRLESSKPLSRFTADQIALLAKLNHADAAHLSRLSRIVVPDRWDLDEIQYSPMPRILQQLSSERKAIVVDLPGQVFGAYESGRLVRWGPVSSGRRARKTPPGTYHLNWRSRVHVSSEDPTWIMPWYFNFSSGRGFALHQYTLPGQPASHGCVRLLTVDAKWFYEWGEGWTLDGDRQMTRPGTLVLLLGNYDFASPPPWLEPEWWVRGLSLSLQQVTAAR